LSSLSLEQLDHALLPINLASTPNIRDILTSSSSSRTVGNVMALVSHQRCLLAGVNDSNKSSLLATQSYFPGSVGQQMQNVQPDRPIGYGAFGVVWSVTDPRSGKKVALKRMPNVFLNLASCKRVFREIRMLCSFKNDNGCKRALKSERVKASSDVIISPFAPLAGWIGHGATLLPSGKRCPVLSLTCIFDGGKGTSQPQQLAAARNLFRFVSPIFSLKFFPRYRFPVLKTKRNAKSDLHKIIVSPQPLTSDHVKVFIYQILRGVKYLHSANILHRDIKPGNLLVNSNCLLKICDFGLARIWDPSEQGHLTHEVVTQYYRAPELLMGARKYTAAVDVWSIGCIFAELLGRRILFQAQGPVEQVLSCLDILHPPNARLFVEIYVLTELMQSDLHKIIVSPQPLTSDHVKVFIYQILRGVKYLHSANILHRDIKPGNLLVNSNCLLKICDFGLARIWDPSEQGHLTHEVVTQYYRAPELLMGARKYTAAVDVWSIGCIFAELLGRRILFQAQGPVEQLNLIIDLLGTPTVTEMKYACEGARSHVLKSPFRSPKLFKLYSLSPHATQEAVDLLAQMLCFDPDQRVGVENALGHPYLEEGRLRFHSCMCSCCRTTASGQRAYAQELEPRHSEAFDVEWEKELSRLSMFDLRDRIYKFIVERTPPYHIPLCINPDSAAFKSFITSSVAQPSELPPSPHAWD
ncbi:hypothetical protein M513_02997, partial [Trichuris suis]